MNAELFKKTLPNGLTFLFLPMPGAESVSIGAWVKVGSRYETDEERGYTHFLEHMLFKGTETRTSRQQAEEIESVGGFFNAVTSREYTYFYVTVAKAEIELGMDILADMIFRPLLREEDVRSESNVIVEELKGYEDSPDDYVYDLYFNDIFNGHNLGRDIIGTRESVLGATRDSICNYYLKHYHPSHMMLSVSGSFDRELVEKYAEKYFSVSSDREPSVLTSTPVGKAFGLNFKKRRLEQVNFLLGAEGFPRDFESAVKLSVVTNILGGGMSSRLFQSIREEKGLCYSISCFPSSYKDAGIVSISCSTSKEKFLYCVESIIEEIRALKKTGFSQKELDFAKGNQKGSLAIGYELPENRMLDIAMQEMYFGKYYSYQDRLEELNKITLDELNECMQQIFSVTKLQLTGVGNLSKADIKKINTEI